MKHAIFTLCVLLLSVTAQGQYTTAGKIEFEKKANMHARMKEYGDGNDSWYERMKSQVPKFSYSYFDLYFDNTKTIYKPGREVENPTKMFGNEPASDNTVLTDLTAKNVKSFKQVFEQKFIVEDSMRKLEWRMKDEIRTIAGYKCRKAVGIVCDSVYVVAFYTEDIIASGGPEMFSGLPGMILELAIPRLYTTWVATKVETTPPNESDFTVPSKGKKVNSKELYQTIQTSLSNWGKWGTRYIWLTLL
jgi:GLPGLI family protein